ncbi:acyltransferase [Crenobacter luteus]|uniref:Phenylacetic acid degradation protein PaaY n=1 Tax=Crenobacter luteus TaxID=1452487 RepID=A0A161TMD3_9NEIS|nr:transferase hexapeptide repeat family protein [Crenobacter luteus]KZE27318.1 phenylacetic acid degradation protein PaaY [Crenobacter luteus]
MQCFAIDGVVPVVSPDAFVHPNATLIGDVVIGPGCYIGPGAVLRGDFGPIRIGAGSNVQDNCVLHGGVDVPLIVEENGHVGHGAILHSCHLEADVLVGMNAVVMDKARIGRQSIVGAMAFVPVGMTTAPRQLLLGLPARAVRTLSDEDVAAKQRGTRAYHHLAARCRRGLVPAVPLAELPARRAALDLSCFAEPGAIPAPPPGSDAPA